MGEREKTKCTVTATDEHGLSVQPCWALSECLDPSMGRGTKRQGLSQPQWVNINTRKPSRSPVVFKGGEHAKSGLVVNYCPFCGHDIRCFSDDE